MKKSGVDSQIVEDPKIRLYHNQNLDRSNGASIQFSEGSIKYIREAQSGWDSHQEGHLDLATKAVTAAGPTDSPMSIKWKAISITCAIWSFLSSKCFELFLSFIEWESKSFILGFCFWVIFRCLLKDKIQRESTMLYAQGTLGQPAYSIFSKIWFFLN